MYALFIDWLCFLEAGSHPQALDLDGLVLNGQSMKLRRPKDYAPLPGTLDSMGMVATQECPTRLHIAGLPSYLKEDQVRPLCSRH
jgi:splicing factor U2AF subunit